MQRAKPRGSSERERKKKKKKREKIQRRDESKQAKKRQTDLRRGCICLPLPVLDPDSRRGSLRRRRCRGDDDYDAADHGIQGPRHRALRAPALRPLPPPHRQGMERVLHMLL
uniref:Uncharacterized protein n=1 Tax=Leersia perrieri TaxID=77586 RepID=A0A0D9XBE0_9ORYZ